MNKYHVIDCKTKQLTTILPEDVINMEEDEEGRIIVYGAGENTYFLITDIDLIKD